MNLPRRIIEFKLDGQRYALDMEAVVRIVRSVEVTPLAAAPDVVMGIVNVHGQIIPVVNVRKRFHLAGKPIELTDVLIIARTEKRLAAWPADAVGDIVEIDGDEIAEAETIGSWLDHVAGVVKRPDGLVLLHDLDRFLSLDEGRALDDALARHEGSAS